MWSEGAKRAPRPGQQRGTGGRAARRRAARRRSAGTHTHGGERGAGYRNLTSPSLPLSFADIFHAVTAFPSCEHHWKKPPVCAAEALTNSRCSYPAATSQERGGAAEGLRALPAPPVPPWSWQHWDGTWYPAEVQPCPVSPSWERSRRLPVPALALATLPLP